MRLHAGRPGLELEILEPFDLGRVGYFLGLANDDHAPPGLIERDRYRRSQTPPSPSQALAELGAQRRAEHDGLRLIVERVVDRTDHCRRHAEGNAPNAAAGRGEHSHAPVPVELEEIDPSVVRCRAHSLAHVDIVHRAAFGRPVSSWLLPGTSRGCDRRPADAHPLASHARHRDDNDVGDRPSRDRPQARPPARRGSHASSAFTNQRTRRLPRRAAPWLLIGHPGVASTAAGRGPWLLARCRA